MVGGWVSQWSDQCLFIYKDKTTSDPIPRYEMDTPNTWNYKWQCCQYLYDCEMRRELYKDRKNKHYFPFCFCYLPKLLCHTRAMKYDLFFKLPPDFHSHKIYFFEDLLVQSINFYTIFRHCLFLISLYPSISFIYLNTSQHGDWKLKAKSQPIAEHTCIWLCIHHQWHNTWQT